MSDSVNTRADLPVPDTAEDMAAESPKASEALETAAAPQSETTQSSGSSATEPKGKECPKFLDLAFAMDCTGSMSSYIHNAQQNIRSIVEQIVSEEKADIRLALVEYRDHPPQDSTFVTRVNDFTSSVRSMKQWLDGCSAQGGGDQAEAVADALQQVLKLSWRDEATKVCVFIADAPPHGIGCRSDGFPNGCPDGLDPMAITNQLAEKQVSLYMVGCEPSIIPFRDFFMGLSHLTGGQYAPLGAAHLLTKVITGGVLEEISLQQMMQDVNQEVLTEFGSRPGEVDEEELTRQVHSKLKSKGMRAKKLRMNTAELPEASVQAQQLSKCENMADARDMYGTSSSRSAAETGFHFGAPAPSAPAPSGGGVTGFLGRMFGSRRSATVKNCSAGPPPAMMASGSAPVPPPMAMSAEAMSAPPMPGAPMSSASDMYDCVEDDISEVQVQRMVQKSVWSNNLKGRYNKKH